jgi:hypothetical protein
VAEVEESLKSFRNTMTGENLFSNVWNHEGIWAAPDKTKGGRQRQGSKYEWKE